MASCGKHCDIPSVSKTHIFSGIFKNRFRLGVVPVKESSIVIAISAPHRNDAIEATQWCIDNVKKSVAIWKKEVYTDQPPQWKENKECGWSTFHNKC